MSPPLDRSSQQLITSFLTSFKLHADVNAHDTPSHYVNNPQILVTNSSIHSFTTGTGSSIFTSLSPLLLSTKHELILVTCFWACSPSLKTLNGILRSLSAKALQRNGFKIRVRICFSSLSLWQKLTHSQSLDGQTYPPSSWVKRFGLPSPDELQGLDLAVKSVFLAPFSVMHPKFAIVDREVVSLMSCNVSWEPWFEGSVTMYGDVVGRFLDFYRSFWEGGREMPGFGASEELERYIFSTEGQNRIVKKVVAADGSGPRVRERGGPGLTNAAEEAHNSSGPKSPIPYARTHILFPSSSSTNIIPTIFLPSPHHRNPRFQPLTRLRSTTAPPTPLNTFLLALFAHATCIIRIQTPNLTAPPVLSALLRALERGVDVEILTSERLMVLEQLVTAGTTTARCMKRLIRRYKKLVRRYETERRGTDEEATIGLKQPGNLQVAYFHSATVETEAGNQGDDGAEEPVQSHIKLTIVDNEMLVLGSGNLDRASWFTSQELGVAFLGGGLARDVGNAVDNVMRGRRKVVFDRREGECGRG